LEKLLVLISIKPISSRFSNISFQRLQGLIGIWMVDVILVLWKLILENLDEIMDSYIVSTFEVIFMSIHVCTMYLLLSFLLG
jgi:hypothetical protein